MLSDVSRGPGWWLASDGRWYPPDLHPALRGAPLPTTPRIRRGPGLGRPLIVVGIVLLAVLVLGAYFGGAALLRSATINGTTIPTGSGFASVTWAKSSGCVTTFSGSAAGLPLSGTATGTFPSSPTASNSDCLPRPVAGATSPPASVLSARWQGTLGGTVFIVNVTLEAQPETPTKGGPVTLGHADGTFGQKDVHVTLSAPSSNSDAIDFSGVVAGRQVHGSLGTSGFASGRAAGRFTVTR